MSKLSILADFLKFLMKQKKYWLIPIIIVLVLLGLLLIFAENSVLSPFVYSLF
jgi:competence protein ComGC